jgi:Tfp pilus assembly protein PilF
VCLFALTWLVFGQTLRHDFINYDDQDYVFANAEVVKGLTGHGIVWAFTGPHSFNWHPLTSLSHMLDCQIFGLKAGGHHFTSVLFHAIGAVLLFLVLWQMTESGVAASSASERTRRGERSRGEESQKTRRHSAVATTIWASAFVALLFALHPLRVESVAWVAERKDVLSGVFFFLTLGAYAHYARNPTRARYAITMLVFAAGLMCKPMLVTMPVLLLALDYWPLNRFRGVEPLKRKKDGIAVGGKSAKQLIIEKLPLLALSLCSSIATFAAQGNAVVEIENFPLGLRVMNALTSYSIYVWQMFVPKDLTLLYPLSDARMTPGRAATSIVILVLVTIGCMALRKTRPYLLVGWIWYVLMLVPVIGLIQVGSQSHADRYTYLPQIGLYIMLAWGFADLTGQWPARRYILTTGAAVVTITLAILTWKQTATWRDSETVWRHAIAVTAKNDTAFRNLGDALIIKERYNDAIVEYKHALQANRNNAGAENGLGTAFMKKGSVERAVFHYQKAIELRPQDAEGHNNLGNALCQKGSFQEGIAEYKRALELRPDPASLYNAETRFNLANVQLKLGQLDEAIANYRQSLQIQPNDASCNDNLGTALMRKGSFAQAMHQYQLALRLDPQSGQINGDYAWALATCSDTTLRNGAKAVELAERARELSEGKDPVILRTLAVAYAETGDFPRAAETAKVARELATSQGNTRLAATLEREIALYQSGSPYRPAH